MSETQTRCELNKLSFHQRNPWNLASTAAATQTSNAGGVRPTNLIRSFVNEESLVSSESNDSLWSNHSSSETDDDEWLKKAPTTRVIVDVDSCKAFMEKSCICQKCNGPVSILFQTTCLATNIMMSCRTSSCGFVCYSEAPAQVELEEDADKRERSTNYAINVLYVLGFISCGDGCTEAARILGLLGLLNDPTMEFQNY